MEADSETYLYTLAGLMITFAGFSALLLGLRQAAGAKLSLLDRYLAKTVMTYIFILAGAAMLPELLRFYDIPSKWIWFSSGLIFGIPMLALQASYPFRRRRVSGKFPPPPIFAVLVVIGSVVTLSMLVFILAGYSNIPAIYVTALTLDFATVAFAFVTALDVIMKEPIETSK
jgi:hypothetical protein